ncbi:hypothetical protein ACWIG4_15185 [Streptomyces sp. NPDC002248]
MTLMPPLPEVDRLPIDDILNEPVERPLVFPAQARSQRPARPSPRKNMTVALGPPILSPSHPSARDCGNTAPSRSGSSYAGWPTALARAPPSPAL